MKTLRTLSIGTLCLAGLAHAAAPATGKASDFKPVVFAAPDGGKAQLSVSIPARMTESPAVNDRGSKTEIAVGAHFDMYVMNKFSDVDARVKRLKSGADIKDVKFVTQTKHLIVYTGSVPGVHFIALESVGGVDYECDDSWDGDPFTQAQVDVMVKACQSLAAAK